VEDNGGLVLRIAAGFPVDSVSVADVEHPALIGFDFGI
jgi:hypothetical protein